MENLKQTMNAEIGMDQFLRNFPGKSEDKLLKLFLGDNWSNKDVLQKRGEYIDIMLQEHEEHK